VSFTTPLREMDRAAEEDVEDEDEHLASLRKLKEFQAIASRHVKVADSLLSF
jgi:hypothetical protein